MKLQLNRVSGPVIILSLLITCLSASLYLTSASYIPPQYRIGSIRHVFNVFIAMQAIGMIFTLGCVILTLCYFFGWTDEGHFIVILFVMLILSLGATLLAIILDLLFQPGFIYILNYVGTVLSIASLASTKLYLS